MQLNKVKHLFIILLAFDTITIFISTVFKQNEVFFKSFASKRKITVKNAAKDTTFNIARLKKANLISRFGKISKIEQHFLVLPKEVAYATKQTTAGATPLVPSPAAMRPQHSFW